MNMTTTLDLPGALGLQETQTGILIGTTGTTAMMGHVTAQAGLDYYGTLVADEDLDDDDDDDLDDADDLDDDDDDDLDDDDDDDDMDADDDDDMDDMDDYMNDDDDLDDEEEMK